MIRKQDGDCSTEKENSGDTANNQRQQKLPRREYFFDIRRDNRYETVVYIKHHSDGSRRNSGNNGGDTQNKANGCQF